jgi:uncharacterized membrane protein YdbT with pleckstrin-like domain
MASYIEGSLLNDETILHQGNISLWSMFPLIFFGVILTPVVIGLVLLIVAYVRYKTTELAVTNKRVVVKTGLISRKVIEINIAKVESVEVQQSVLGRLFNFGSLSIAGTGFNQAPIPNISDPMGFRKALTQAQAKQ